jgi:hypothetical protein
MLRSGKATSKDGTAPAAYAPPPDGSRNGGNVLKHRFMVSESGFFDGANMAVACREFEKTWAEQHPNLACLCIWDQVGIHRTLDVLSGGLKNGVYYFSSLANASHILAALDGAIFAVYKEQIKRIFNDAMFDAILTGAPTDAQCALLNAAHEAGKKAFSQAVLAHAFQARGVVPQSLDVQRALVHKRVGLASETDSAVTAAAVAAALVRAADLGKPARRQRVSLVPRTLYSPEDIVAVLEEQASATTAKKEAAAAKKRAAKEKKEAAQAKKQAAATKKGDRAVAKAKTASERKRKQGSAHCF